MSEKYLNLVENMAEYEQQISILNDEINQLGIEKDHLKETTNYDKTKIQNLSTENKYLHDELKLCTDNFEKLKLDMNTQEMQIKCLTSDNRQWEKNFKIMKDELEHKNEILNNDMTSIKQELSKQKQKDEIHKKQDINNYKIKEDLKIKLEKNCGKEY